MSTEDTAEAALVRKISLRMERLQTQLNEMQERVSLLEMDNATTRLRLAQVMRSRPRKKGGA